MKKTERYVLPMVFLMILPVIVFAGEINLPKTGQTTCYDKEGVVIDCAGTGQDDDIQAGVEWPSPRFTDNNDGTVTDNLTGLMWLKDANCFGSRAWSGRFYQSVWDVVTDFNTSPQTYNCSDYTANYDDWRLPNVLELESLVNAEESSSAIWLNTQGFTNVQPSNYWSATTRAGHSDSASVVEMGSGVVDYEGKGSSYNKSAWPVRAGQDGGFPNAVSEIIGTWSNGIWYLDEAASKWIQMARSTPDGDITAGDFTGDGIADVASCWDSGLWYQDGATLSWTKLSGAAPDSVTAGDVTGN